MLKHAAKLTTTLLIAAPICAAAQQPDFPVEEEFVRANALRALSGAAGIGPEDLRILSQKEANLANLGASFRLFKVLNTRTGESRRIALDASGRPVDADELLRREREARYQRYGNMQVELAELVARAPERTIPVLVKLNIPEEPADKARLPQGQELQAAAERSAAANAAVEQRALQALRGALDEPALAAAERIRQSGPFVALRLPAAAIQRLSRDPRVAFVGLHDEPEIPDYPTIAASLPTPDYPTTAASLPTTRTDIAHSAGTKGAGVKVAVLEEGTTNVPAACFNIGATQDPGAGVNNHMTKSVGIIGNRYNNGACDGAWQGYAPEATVLLANAASYTDGYDWARSQGVNVVTMSWHFGSEETSGDLHSRDVYFDYWTTRYPYPSVFTSAGNEAESDAYASGKGHNFFGVANILNDGDSGNRCNDAIAGSSSWKDPISPHGDREVPAIATPGSRHDLLGSSFGGTSAATPVAASIAALLMSRNSNLIIWPEAIRAILLTTANYQNGDGADWTRFADGKDGTGLLNTWYAHLTAERRETTDTSQFRAHDYDIIGASNFSEGFLNRTWKAFTATTDARIRVGFTWNSKVTETSSVLDADLDLWVYDPDMNLVAYSTSWDSSYEFVEFAPGKTGDYTIRVRGYSVPADLSTFFGVAWTTHYDLCP